VSSIEISLSNWNRSLCKTIDYPAFDNPEPILLPDVLTEKMSGFSGFVCYETTFVLDSPKVLILEISNTIGGVEIFMNGETLGIKARPPYHFDLSNQVRQGKNYLAIEVALVNKFKNMIPGENEIYIIGNVNIYGY
jgi:hypothetical protein